MIWCARWRRRGRNPSSSVRACCQRLSPDEATVTLLTEAGCARDRSAFDAAIGGLVRPDRHEPLWAAFTHALMLMR
jgi:hypothetical protein